MAIADRYQRSFLRLLKAYRDTRRLVGTLVVASSRATSPAANGSRASGSKMGTGCPVCRDSTHVWVLGEHDPEPPMRCVSCGRPFEGWVRIYVGVDPDAV